MCNNITTIATSFWFHFFSRPIHFGQFFGTSFNSPPFIPPKIWGRNWSDRHVDCWRRASVLPSSDHPHVLFTVPWVWWEDRAALRGCKNLRYFFLGGLRGGVDPCFCIFFRIWEFFFLLDIRWIQSCFFFEVVGVMLSSLVLRSKFRPEKSSTKAATAWCACVAIADDARKNTETPVPGDGEPYARSEKRACWIWRRIGFWCAIFRLSYWLSYRMVIGLCHGVLL